MNIGYCHLCGKKIPKWFRQDAYYCSDECRKKIWEIYHRLEPKRLSQSKRNGLKLSVE